MEAWSLEAWSRFSRWSLDCTWQLTPNSRIPMNFFLFKKKKRKIWGNLEGFWRNLGCEERVAMISDSVKELLVWNNLYWKGWQWSVLNLPESYRILQNCPETSWIFQNLTELSRNLQNHPESSRFILPWSSRISRIFQYLPGSSRNLHNFLESSRIIQDLPISSIIIQDPPETFIIS